MKYFLTQVKKKKACNILQWKFEFQSIPMSPTVSEHQSQDDKVTLCPVSKLMDVKWLCTQSQCEKTLCAATLTVFKEATQSPLNLHFIFCETKTGSITLMMFLPSGLWSQDDRRTEQVTKTSVCLWTDMISTWSWLGHLTEIKNACKCTVSVFTHNMNRKQTWSIKTYSGYVVTVCGWIQCCDKVCVPRP